MTTTNTLVGNRKSAEWHHLTVIAGTRNTPDEAYRVLYFELEDRQRAWDAGQASVIRNKAKKLKLEKRQTELDLVARRGAPDEIAQLELDADVYEYEAGQKTMDSVIEGCRLEMEFMKGLMAFLYPLCKYVGYMELGEAFEACQADEWKLEWIKRAENFLLTIGTIPTDHFESMRAHPCFESEIQPAIEEIRYSIITNQNGMHNLKLRTPNFVSQLLETYTTTLLPAAPGGTQLLLGTGQPEIESPKTTVVVVQESDPVVEPNLPKKKLQTSKKKLPQDKKK